MTYAQIIFASGSKGAEVRADGHGSTLKRGFYFMHAAKTWGPFSSEAQAALVRTILTTRKMHETELFRGELNALRALRKKGVIANVGLYLTADGRSGLSVPHGDTL